MSPYEMSRPRIDQVIRLLAVGRSSSGDFAQRADKLGGGVRIGERLQMNRGGELRRFRAEVYLQNSCRRADMSAFNSADGSCFQWVRVVRITGPGSIDIPFAVVALARRNTAVMGAPVMSHDFQMKTRRAVQVGFESQRFFLLVPATHQPMNRNSTRPELHCYPRHCQTSERGNAAEPARREVPIQRDSRMRP